MGRDATAALAGLIVLDLLIAAVLLYMQRFNTTVTPRQAALNYAMGGLPVSLVAVVSYLGS